MGYEIKMIVGRAKLEGEEIKVDKLRPYADGSGFEYERDINGAYVRTGRKEHWFDVFAEIDLCKLGYQDDAFNRIIAESHATAKARNGERFYYFYGIDGNTRITEDRYDSPMWPVPVMKVLEALIASRNNANPYRRTEWAIGLLTGMANDPEGLEVLFFGH